MALYFGFAALSGPASAAAAAIGGEAGARRVDSPGTRQSPAGRDAGAASTSVPAGDPDALYGERADPAKARAAADIWSARLRASNDADFESAWKLARAAYYLGTQGPDAERRRVLEEGVAAGRIAARLRPNAPEGHFWFAATMGTLAESFGLRQGLKYRKPIREALERVLAIDPSYQGWSADRALGRWYFKVPRLFGGSRDKSLEHLRRSIEKNPQNTVSYFFLAETLEAMGRTADARTALETLLALPDDPEWLAEDRAYKAKARAMLARSR